MLQQISFANAQAAGSFKKCRNENSGHVEEDDGPRSSRKRKRPQQRPLSHLCFDHLIKSFRLPNSKATRLRPRQRWVAKTLMTMNDQGRTWDVRRNLYYLNFRELVLTELKRSWHIRGFRIKSGDMKLSRRSTDSWSRCSMRSMSDWSICSGVRT